MLSHPRVVLLIGITFLLVLVPAYKWLWLGAWPDPHASEIPWEPDAIVVLGGGDPDRSKAAGRIAERFPKAPVIVTGDSGEIVRRLDETLAEPERLSEEPNATSTYENATLTRTMLDEIGAQRVVLVSSWYHVPRAKAVFETVQADREFVTAFEEKSKPLPESELEAQRRERFASAWYLIRYGIRSF